MKLLKWLGGAVVAIVLLLCVAVGIIYMVGGSRIARAMTAPGGTVAVPTDSAALARGQHLVDAVAKCTDCHGAHFGGQVVIDGMPFMRLPAPNITSGTGGVVASFSDADWVRVLRHGLAPDGHRLALMPADAYTFFNDEDLGAVIAYVKTLPPVNKPTELPRYGMVGRALITFGGFPLWTYDLIDHARPDVFATASMADTLAYGRYLMRTGGCMSCHGDNLAGGPIPGMPPEMPPAANLTPSGIGTYTEADFFRILREGKKPGDLDVNEAMPWRLSGHMTDAEIHAVWTYIQSVPAAAYGSR